MEVNSPDSGFTDEFLTHAYTPQNVGLILDPDGFGSPTGACGDTIEIYLRVDRDEKIERAVFMTDGCAHTIACASVITTIATGSSIEDALKIKADRIIDMLGGLPEDHVHCAKLAVSTLKLAIKDYRKRKDAPKNT